MTAHRDTDTDTGQTVVTFELAGDVHEGISVVGSFNEWTPGADVLEPRQDVHRRVTVTVDADSDIHFPLSGLRRRVAR